MASKKKYLVAYGNGYLRDFKINDSNDEGVIKLADDESEAYVFTKKSDALKWLEILGLSSNLIEKE